jgi:prophage DNA circulation protein
MVNISDYSQLTLSNSTQLVTLFWRADSYSAGQKIVQYDFPYKDGVFIENLGKSARRFNITALVDVNTSFFNANTLEQILQSGEFLRLQLPLPIDGQRNFELLQVDGVYTINRSLTTGGYFEVSIPLIQSIEQPTYEQVPNRGLFGKLAGAIFGEAGTQFVDNFSTKYDTLQEKVQEGKDLVQQGINATQNTAIALRNASNLAVSTVDTVNDFISSANELIDSAETLVRTPAVLSEKITNTFVNLQNTFDNAGDLFNVAKNLANFSLSTGKDNSSATKQQEQKNAETFEINIKANALALQYLASGNIDYQTQEDLFDIQKQLQDSWELLPDNIRTNTSLYNRLQEMKIATARYLQGLAVSLPFTTTIDINSQPLTMLHYNLYGNTNNVDLLFTLNTNITDAQAMSGNIKILTNV